MKIKPEHYAVLRDEIKQVATPAKVAMHRTSLESDPQVKDINKRLRWDCLYVARLSAWISENIYPYANDEHIDTALRQIVGEIEQDGYRVDRLPSCDNCGGAR